MYNGLIWVRQVKFWYENDVTGSVAETTPKSWSGQSLVGLAAGWEGCWLWECCFPAKSVSYAGFWSFWAGFGRPVMISGPEAVLASVWSKAGPGKSDKINPISTSTSIFGQCTWFFVKSAPARFLVRRNVLSGKLSLCYVVRIVLLLLKGMNLEILHAKMVKLKL